MYRRLFAPLLILVLVSGGCKKAQNLEKPDAKSSSVATKSAASATPAPLAAATPTPAPVIDRTARFIVLCYHRFEDKPHDSLAIAPAEFHAQMQALKDNGIAVISMKDLLAWRRGEKSIPAKSCVITIDDGYTSGYNVAWPILKEYGYPFTMFIYTNYVEVGGKSITWAQLEEMRDAGVDIESHTVSHRDLRHAPAGQDYNTWLHNEIYTSKDILEQHLGIKISVFAFPYGTFNEVVRKMALDAGYEALFTVYGQHMGIDAPADQIGRYAIESTHPDVFKAALNFGANGEPGSGPAASAQLAAASMVTQPMSDEHISDSKPTIKANLATMGEVEPNSVEMRVSGFGLVPAKYDPQTKLVSYEFTQRLIPKTYTVILSAKVKGRKVETKWNFTVDQNAPMAKNAAAG
ncbi:MAG: polysaccharide deacetylase family protein [Chthoniobacterales bacterium]